MNELIDIIIRGLQLGEAMALITIIETIGSTPRKAGAKMLVFRDGRTFGTIGGGCSEAQVKTYALYALDTGKSFRHTITMTDTTAADEGMMCGGIMHVFVQVINKEKVS